jgi:acyl carrier protein
MTGAKIIPDAVHQRAILWARVAHSLVTLHPEIPVDRVAEGRTALVDLGCDELDVVAIIIDLEGQLGRDLPDTIITDDMTVRQCADALLSHLQEKIA